MNASKLTLTNLRKAPTSITLKNVEDSLKLIYQFDGDGNTPSISGGPLGNRSFPLTFLQFRWKSGHFVNQNQFSAELQLSFEGPVKLSFMMKVTKNRILKLFSSCQKKNFVKKYVCLTLSYSVCLTQGGEASKWSKKPNKDTSLTTVLSRCKGNTL